MSCGQEMTFCFEITHIGNCMKLTESELFSLRYIFIFYTENQIQFLQKQEIDFLSWNFQI